MTEWDDPLPKAVREVVDDSARTDVLAALEIMHSAPDADFDRLTRIAAELFGAEFALVTLIDDERQWFKSCFGIDDLDQTGVEVSFCAHTIAVKTADYLVIPNMLTDERFANNPFVTDWPQARFYAGASITVRGQRLGTICVLDTKPRENVPESLIRQLVDLAGVASSLFELKDEARVRARTAAELMREEWRHALSLEAGKVGSWVWDIRSGEMTCNDTFRRMYGLPESGAIHIDQVMAAIDREHIPGVEDALERAFAGGADYAFEMRVGDRWLTTRGRVYQRDESGKPLVMMGASLDVTDSKQAAEHTRLLLRELNHRVKNTLAMIQSVARQTIRQNPDPQRFIDAFSGRLRTLSDTHVLLADRDWAGVQLYDVVAGQLGPDFQSRPDRATVSGPDMLLPADHALGLGLILHELTTNAHNHGSWSNEEGMVTLRWEVREQPVHGVALSWTETLGPEVPERREPGLGTRLIERSLAKVLDSTVMLSFAREGVHVDVWMPLCADQ